MMHVFTPYCILRNIIDVTSTGASSAASTLDSNTYAYTHVFIIACMYAHVFRGYP